MSKLRDDLYQRLHEFKPIKRSYKKQGQSDWYYLDPRYDDDDKRGQVDVINENSPNPRLSGILADDMDKNPEDYYIWRTKGDDKVRSAHAAREGLIFNKHIPPEGGNPGEDYNCRCWAEPYKPEKIERLGITAKVDLSGLPQYAENDKANTASDSIYNSNSEYAHRKVKFRSPEEEKLLKRIGKQIIEREKTVNYAYLDSSGYITTGNGALINDWESFKKVHWLYNGRPATEAAMRAEFNRMEKIREDIDAEAKAEAIKNNRPYASPFRKITADRYEEGSILKITKDEADYLMYSHLQRDYDNLKCHLPEIDNAPEAAQDVAFDIQYNPGITAKTWNNFKKYFNEQNVPELAEQVHRKGISEDRNDEMKGKILSIKKW